MMSELVVSQLAIYPVKSFAQVSLNSAYVDGLGLENDRRWMIVDENDHFVTQRQLARMCLIQPKLVGDGVQLDAPGMPTLFITTPSTGRTRLVTVWKDRCHSLDCGNEAAAWLSRFLATDCRLVYFPATEVRVVDPTYAKPGDRTAFSDGFPILLLSQASLGELNRRLKVPIPMARFRPNIVVSGGAPFAEDDWRKLRIGEFTYRVVKPCSRCVIPTIDVKTAKRGAEPTRTLSTFRKRDNRIYFGQNVIPDGEGDIRVGMSVEVLT